MDLVAWIRLSSPTCSKPLHELDSSARYTKTAVSVVSHFLFRGGPRRVGPRRVATGLCRIAWSACSLLLLADVCRYKYTHALQPKSRTTVTGDSRVTCTKCNVGNQALHRS